MEDKWAKHINCDSVQITAALGEVVQRIAESAVIALNEFAEALSSFLAGAGVSVYQQSLEDIMAALGAVYQDCEDEKDRRFWKSYRCTRHRRHNIRAFQKLPYGYQAPLPVRNTRTMIRRTI